MSALANFYRNRCYTWHQLSRPRENTVDKVYVVDFEGNGDNPPDIIELALVEILSWTELGRTYHWLLRPAVPISRMVSRIHGLTDDDVADAPSFSDIQDDLHELLTAACLIGHKVHVDVGALKRKLPEWEPARTLDTLRLAKRLKPNLVSYSLHKLAATLGIESAAGAGRSGQPHSAVYDATMTANLFLKLLADHRQLGMKFLLDAATAPQDLNARLPL